MLFGIHACTVSTLLIIIPKAIAHPITCELIILFLYYNTDLQNFSKCNLLLVLTLIFTLYHASLSPTKRREETKFIC